MKNILIIGGYGTIGSIVSEKLSQEFPGKIVVAGRNLEKAKELAQRIGNGIIPLQLDLENFTDKNALNGIGLVIMCIDQQNTSFVELCIQQGVHYIDITADPAFSDQVLHLHHKAKKNRVSIILSVGLAPGITNLLAQYARKKLPKAEWLNLFVLLGLGEHHGEASYRWTFDNIHSCYEIKDGDRLTKLVSFTSPVSTWLLGMRTFYLFNFSDQHYLSTSTNLEHIRTRVAFDSSFLTWLLAIFRRIGVTRLTKMKKIQNGLIALLRQRFFGTDSYGVKAVIGTKNGMTKEFYLTGKGEGIMTANSTVLTVLLVLKGQSIFGVSHLDEWIKDIPGFLQDLNRMDNSIEIHL